MQLQALAGAQRVVRVDAVQAGQRDHIHVVALGDRPQRIAASAPHARRARPACDGCAHRRAPRPAAPAAAARTPTRAPAARSPSAIVLAVPEFIQFAQVLRGGAEALRDRGDGVARAHGVALDAHALVRRELQQALAEGFGRFHRHQQEVRAGRVGGPAVIRRVQVVHFLGRDAGELRGHLDADLAAGLHPHEVGLVRHALDADRP